MNLRHRSFAQALTYEIAIIGPSPIGWNLALIVEAFRMKRNEKEILPTVQEGCVNMI
jgi:hypothetical protein